MSQKNPEGVVNIREGAYNMEIKKGEKTMRSIIVYETVDGRKFREKELAEKHEGSLQDIKAYEVHLSDETSRKIKLKGYLLVHAKEHHDMFAEYWGYGRYGNRVKFENNAYDSAAVRETWKLNKCDVNEVDFELIIEKIEEDSIVKIWNTKESQK